MMQCLLSGWILYSKYHILHVGVHQFVLVNSVSIVTVNFSVSNLFEVVSLFTENRVLTVIKI